MQLMKLKLFIKLPDEFFPNLGSLGGENILKAFGICALIKFFFTSYINLNLDFFVLLERLF